MKDLIKTTNVSPINFVNVLIVSILNDFRRYYRDFYNRVHRIEEEIDELTDREHIEFVNYELVCTR